MSKKVDHHRLISTAVAFALNNLEAFNKVNGLGTDYLPADFDGPIEGLTTKSKAEYSGFSLGNRYWVFGVNAMQQSSAYPKYGMDTFLGTFETEPEAMACTRGFFSSGISDSTVQILDTVLGTVEKLAPTNE